MADIAAAFADWSTTASSNAPSGSTNVGTGLDNNLQQIQATLRAALGSKGADIASSSTTDLGAVAGLFHDITGTTAITSFGTVAAGIWKVIKFEGALTLTHNATSLILPGGANITTADGDMAMVTSEGSGNWRMNWFCKASVVPYGTAAVPLALGGTGAVLVDPNADRLMFWDDSAGAVAFLTPGTGLTITTTTMTATAGITLATKQATTSGTSFDFTGIPAGTKRITVMCTGVSTNGSSSLLVQVGDSGGIETSGYNSIAGGVTSGGAAEATIATTGFILNTRMTAALNGDDAIFTLVMNLLDASTFRWLAEGNGYTNNVGALTAHCGGTKALSAELDRVRFTTVNGTDTFDAGVVNISYEQ